MNKMLVALAMVAALASPALAFEIEEIGTIEADFGGETIVQPTVLASNGTESSSTAFLLVLGGGFSALSFAGFSMDNARLGIEVSFMSEAPDPDTAPINLTITFSPEGTGKHWTSEEAPSPATVAFTTLTAEGEDGRVTGTFNGLLCYAEGYEAEPDTTNCRPIQGSFDTPITVER